MIYDVTPRYAYQWLTHCKKLRVDNDWWRECLERYAPPTEEQELEDEDIMSEYRVDWEWDHSLIASWCLWYHVVSYGIL